MSKRNDRLGMSAEITRRDFVQSTLLGSGAALLQARAPVSHAQVAIPAGEVSQQWYGYGGVGDYADSHGNTPDVVNTAHRVRDGLLGNTDYDVTETDEVYDLLIVGAGIAGLGAAFEHSKQTNGDERCLILENHPMFGGESKRNEFEVDGHKLIGPQGANGFSVPNSDADRATNADVPDLRYMRELGIPYDFEYGELRNSDRGIALARDNYGYQYWQEDTATVAHYLKEGASQQAKWFLDPIKNNYRDLPFSAKDRQDIADWRRHNFSTPDRPNFNQWLDSMTYKQYIEDELGFGPAVTRWADPIMAGGCGLGCDAISAYGAWRLGMPIYDELPDYNSWSRNSLPGGNDGFARHFLKKIMPRAIEGDDNPEDVIAGKVRFDQLDVDGEPFRMRLRSTVIRVEHEGSHENASHVVVDYSHGDRIYRVRARRVIMATGGWINKHVIRDLPQSYHEAYSQFFHVPFLIANVAVRNWRFLERLGTGACMWTDGVFGNSCNVRLPMKLGGHQSVVDPDDPAVLTFYVSYTNPGLPAQTQGALGRVELFTTSYAEYERRIRTQMLQLFGATGFNPEQDIAGIVLNRWGHAYLAPQPGFFFARDGQPSPREIISQRFGRIAIAHAELGGIQHWGPAADQGRRAARELADVG